MANLNFNKDLEIGKTTEHIVAQLLRIFTKTNFDIMWNDDNRYDFGISIPSLTDDGTLFTVEVKDDIGSMNTPNVFVEFECRGKPSGILVTIADALIYKIYNSPVEANFYVLCPDDIKLMIEQKEYNRIVNDAGDVGSNTKGYLFTKEIIIANAYLLATERKKIILNDNNISETVTYCVDGITIKQLY